MKSRTLALLCAGVLVIGTAAAGCANSSAEPAQSTQKESTQEKSTQEESGENKEEAREEELKSIGAETDGALKAEMKNSTGKDISGISVKKAEEKEYPANMLESSDVYKNEESRYLYYRPDGETDQQYDVQLTFADGSVSELHAFPFADIEKGELCLDGDDPVAYIEYTAAGSGEKIATKEAELELVAKAEARAKKKAEAKAKKKAEAAAKKKAEEEAKAAAEAQAAAEAEAQAGYDDNYYDDSQNYQQDTSQSWDDGCVGDGLTY